MVGDLYLAGLLHDIGKIGVRDDVLLKPGPLTDSERANIEQHPAIGDAILARTSMLARLRPGVRHHHQDAVEALSNREEVREVKAATWRQRSA